jgi:hypothetical protein
MILSHTLPTRVIVGVSNALRELAGVLDEYDTGSVVAVGSAERSDGATTVTARIELPISTDPSNGDRTTFGLSDARVTADGELTFALASDDPLASRHDDVTVEPTDVTLTDDGPPTVTLTVAVPTGADRAPADTSNGDDAGSRDVATTGGDATGDGTATGSSTGDGAVAGSGGDDPTVAGAASGVGSPADSAQDEASLDATSTAADADEGSTGTAAAGRDRDVPPFRDRELLAEVYDSCDTFAEMTEELGMDVTAETVRRYMVDHDIHQPNSYETGSEQVETPATEPEGDRPPVALPDGLGLPDDVTVDSFIETIKRSNTIYEVKRDVGIPQEDALDMLKQLNLIDLVVGRLATEGERDIQREDIVDRLREASASQ